MPLISTNPHDDFKFMLPGSKNPIVILRRWHKSTTCWIAFFEHEADTPAQYDGMAKTPEEAIELFLKHRIEEGL